MMVHDARQALTRSGLGAMVVILLALGAADAAQAACKQGMVFVKPKTAVRRGPGLNFAPSTLLEDGRCYTFEEVSADQAWVLIKGEGGSPYGWVSASSIDAEGRAALGAPVQKGSVGSTPQPRGFVVVRTQGSLLAVPDPRGRVKKALPPGARLLALSVSDNGKWVEVRDERGETGWFVARGVTDDADVLSGLPRKRVEIDASDLVAEEEEPVAAPPRRRPPRSQDGERVLPKDELDEPGAVSVVENDTALEASVLGLLAFPQQGLSSNGIEGRRRYTLRAFASGAHLEAVARGLGPIRARIAYDFVLLAGLKLAGVDGNLGGQQHDGRILAGYPVVLGPLIAVPEVGYAFAIFSMASELPSGGGPQFASSLSHGLHLGSTAEYSLSEDIRIDGEAGLVFGTTRAYGLDLGGSKLTVTLRGAVSGRYALGSGLSLVGRWELLWQRSPFAGISKTDPTITQATLTHIGNAFGVGVALEL